MKAEYQEYYKINYETKIFYDKKNHQEKAYYILYLNDFKKECENFVDTFVAYLPAYAKNDNTLSYFFTGNNINEKLSKESKRIFTNSKILPHRPMKTDGLYGELFLDFYSRIVKDENFFITFVCKRPYNLDYENYGYDEVYYSINECNKISLIISESKFVDNKNSCKKSFIIDINGNEKEKSHFTKEYFEDYFEYILEKQSYESYNDKNKQEIIKNFIEELNIWGNEGKNYIDYIKENDIKVKVVLFGIFSSKEEEIIDFESIYTDLEDNLTRRLTDMGLSNFDIEIVFIPTKSTSMEIKGEINKYYEKN